MAFHERRLHLVRDAMDGLQERTGAAAQSAAERIEDAADEISRYARVATDCLEEWGRDARSSLQRDPVIWSLVSLGAITLIGLGAAFLARQRKEEQRRRRRAAQLRSNRASRTQRPSHRRGNSATASP
jgi:hypothetical protein